MNRSKRVQESAIQLEGQGITEDELYKMLADINEALDHPSYEDAKLLQQQINSPNISTLFRKFTV